jgi:hypothetical protein
VKITIDSTEPLEDAIRVVGAVYGVTLTVAPENEAVTPAGGSSQEAAKPARRTRSRQPAKSRRSSTTRANGRRRRTTAVAKVSNAQLREWARENGHTVSDRGRIPAAVVSAYREAQKA